MAEIKGWKCQSFFGKAHTRVHEAVPKHDGSCTSTWMSAGPP